MSVKHIGLVLDHLDIKPAPKLVAVVLADHADVDGICWPSYRRIAQRTGLDERTVRRHIATLIDLGVVTKIRTGTIRKNGDKVERITNAYRIDADALASMPSKLSTDDLGKVDTFDHLEVGAADRHRWGGLSTKSSKNHQKNNRQSVDIGDNSTIILADVLKRLQENAS